jgi:hypothetical protein
MGGKAWMRLAVLTFLILLQIDAQAFGGNYGVNLANPDVYWYTVLSDDRVPYVQGTGVVSSGPYYIDINHREGALLVGPLAVLLNGHSSGNYHSLIGEMDFRNVTVRLNLELDHQPSTPENSALEGGQVVFWFQSELKERAIAGDNEEMPPRYVNYYWNQNLLPQATTQGLVEIPVAPDLNKWTCLGHNPIDTRPIIGSAAKYTCALNQQEFAEAMAKPISAGILFLFPRKKPDGSEALWLDPSNPNRTKTMGNTKFILSEFTIIKPHQTVSAQH